MKDDDCYKETRMDKTSGRVFKKDFIKKVGKKIGVFSEGGKKLGEHATEGEARAQLAAVEISKKQRGDGANQYGPYGEGGGNKKESAVAKTKEAYDLSDDIDSGDAGSSKDHYAAAAAHTAAAAAHTAAAKSATGGAKAIHEKAAREHGEKADEHKETGDEKRGIEEDTGANDDKPFNPADYGGTRAERLAKIRK